MKVVDEEKKVVCSTPPLVPQPQPWLVVCHGKHQQIQTFFSISENRYYPRTIPELHSKLICTSNYGCLLLQDIESKACSLLYLDSMEKLQLPTLEFYALKFSILSSAPNDPNCHIMFSDGKNSHVFFCKPGDAKCVKQEFMIVDDTRLVSATTLEGKIYGLTSSIALVIADFGGGLTLQFRQLIRNGLCNLRTPLGVFVEHYLIESGGELLCVHKIYSEPVGNEVSDFEVLRADFSEMVWVTVESIGEKRTIFLGPNEGVSYSAAEAKTKGNCIYFLEQSDRNLYIFDFNDRSVSVSLPCPKVDKIESFLCWV